MRMHRLFFARLEPKLEHAHLVVVEQDLVKLWRRFHRVLAKAEAAMQIAESSGIRIIAFI